MKATAIAHPIQGLIKYHGLKDPRLRIPFHDSISVCAEALTTITTVEVSDSLEEDIVIINEKKAIGKELERVEFVLNKLRITVNSPAHFRVTSRNSVMNAKGLGFSASGFAALGTAACAALDFDIDYMLLSELVRLGAGSATRSLAGSFAIWYANRNGKSYAEPIVKPGKTNLCMVIVPIPSLIETDDAHSEVLSSPLFRARLRYVAAKIKAMKEAIRTRDLATIGKLAEEDTLNLHASTMTGKAHMLLWEPETLCIIKEVQRMRSHGIPVWYSIDTGPSVFINTYAEYVDTVANGIRELGCSNIVLSKVGGKPFLSNNHLF